MNAASGFSYADLARLFQRSLEQGYQPRIFGEEDQTETPYILWRHDVDLELPAAIRLAELESQLGIRSTFFLLPRSWFYNLFAWEGLQAVTRIKELGHTLGLHCDLNLPREAEVADELVLQRVNEDFDLLDRAFPGSFDRIVSFHNPPRSVLKRSFASFYSTYQPKFFGQIKYLSDSNRRWREGPLERWLDARHTPQLSILLHPVIWAYPGTTMPEAMEAYLRTRMERYRQKLIEDDIELEARPAQPA